MPSSLLVFLLFPPAGQTCSLITLAGRVRGRVVSPWPAEGVGRETRAMVAMRTGNTILCCHGNLFRCLNHWRTNSVRGEVASYLAVLLSLHPHTFVMIFILILLGACTYNSLLVQGRKINYL